MPPPGGRERSPILAAHRAEQHRIRGVSRTYGLCGQGMSVGVYRRAAYECIGETELVSEAFRNAFKHPPRGMHDLRTDAVSGKEKNVSLHVSPPP